MNLDAKTQTSNEYLDNFQETIGSKLPGVVAVLNLADFKRRNNHLGWKVGDDDIEELERLLSETLTDKCFYRRFAGDGWIVFLPEDSIYFVEKVIAALQQTQEISLGWQCIAVKNGETRTEVEKTRTLIHRAVRCVWSNVSNLNDIPRTVDELTQKVGLGEINKLNHIDELIYDGAPRWKCVDRYPDKIMYCPFCKGVNFRWEDGDMSVYGSSGECSGCGAGVDFRNYEELPPK